MRLDSEILGRVDQWRAEQDGQPSRAEAMRRMIELGLTVSSQDTACITDGEKLLAMMLKDIYSKLGIDKGEVDPNFVAEAVVRGHYWALKWEYAHLFEVQPAHPGSVRFVCNILNMWTVIEQSYESFSKKQQEEIRKEADDFKKDIKFRGFDGNDECEHWSITKFLIDKMGRYSQFSRRDLNTGWLMIPGYQRMLEVFDQLKGKLRGRKLTVAEVKYLLKAQRTR